MQAKEEDDAEDDLAEGGGEDGVGDAGDDKEGGKEEDDGEDEGGNKDERYEEHEDEGAEDALYGLSSVVGGGILFAEGGNLFSAAEEDPDELGQKSVLFFID